MSIFSYLLHPTQLPNVEISQAFCGDAPLWAWAFNLVENVSGFLLRNEQKPLWAAVRWCCSATSCTHLVIHTVPLDKPYFSAVDGTEVSPLAVLLCISMLAICSLFPQSGGNGSLKFPPNHSSHGGSWVQYEWGKLQISIHFQYGSPHND